MNNIWYLLMKVYVNIGLFFLLKKIKVYGVENVPRKGAVLFMANHQNALIDAVLIPTTNKRIIHFLARASAFKNPTVYKILRALKMIPIYRIRDGVDIIEKNKPIFEKCHEILKNKGAIEIFPEGEHHLTRKIIPLKKGFARIILGTLEKYPHLQIKIVPVGINFDSHLNYPSSCSIYYGKTICANDFIDPTNPDFSFNAIKNEVRSALKKLTLDIDSSHEYDETIRKLENYGVDYLNPTLANELVTTLTEQSLNEIPPVKKKQVNWFLPLQLLAKLNSILPLLIWRYLKGRIKEVIFTNTFRFAVILTLFPIFYILQMAIIGSFFGATIGVYYLFATIIIGIICTKTSPIDP